MAKSKLSKNLIEKIKEIKPETKTPEQVLEDNAKKHAGKIKIKSKVEMFVDGITIEPGKTFEIDKKAAKHYVLEGQADYVNKSFDINFGERSNAGVPKKLLEVLSKEKKENMQLKCGFFDNKLYYGTNVEIDGKIENLIVFSDGTPVCGQQAIKYHGINYNCDFQEHMLKGHISNKIIKKFLEGSINAPTFKEMADSIYRKNSKYMYYPNDVSHKIVVCDIMATYFLPLFNSFGRTVFVAEAGSGKTRQAELYEAMAFNTFKTSDMTSAVMFRLLESSVVTLIIDDTDNLSKERMEELMQHFKTGYKKGAKAARMGDGSSKGKIETFSNYGHVVINNTIGFDDISMDRSKEIEIIKSNDPNITSIDVEDEPKRNWSDIRDYMFLLAMNRWGDVKDSIKKVSKSKLNGRQLEVCTSVLAVAKLIDESWFNECLVYFEEMFKDRQSNVSDGDWGFELCKQFFLKENYDEIQNKDLAKELLSQEDITSANPQYKKLLNDRSRFVSKYFRKMKGLFKPGRNAKGNFTQLKDKEKFCNWLKTKGWERMFKESTLDVDPIPSRNVQPRKVEDNLKEELIYDEKSYDKMVAIVDAKENENLYNIYEEIHKTIRDNDKLRQGMDSGQISSLLRDVKASDIHIALDKMVQDGMVSEHKPGLYIA